MDVQDISFEVSDIEFDSSIDYVVGDTIHIVNRASGVSFAWYVYLDGELTEKIMWRKSNEFRYEFKVYGTYRFKAYIKSAADNKKVKITQSIAVKNVTKSYSISHDTPVVLHPFNAMSVLLYHKLKLEGFDVVRFSDPNPLLNKEQYDNTPITPVYHCNELIIVCESKIKDFRETKELYMSQAGVPPEMVADGNMISTKADDFDAAMHVDTKQFSKLFSPYKYYYRNHNNELIMLRRLQFLSNHGREGNVFQNVQLTMTQRCTLKCRDCVTLTPKFNNPVDCDINQTVASFEKFMATVDFVNRLVLCGGEPFLNHNLGTCLMKLEDIGLLNRVGLIQIVTNGTIVPPDELLEQLAGLNLLVTISNYKTLSKNINKLVAKLNLFNVNYYIDYRPAWYSTGMPRLSEPLDVEDSKKQRLLCRSNCRIIWNDEFYFCAFLKSAEQIGMIPNDSRNSLKIDKVFNYEKLERYMNAHYPGCAYCVGWPKTHYSLPAAVQL